MALYWVVKSAMKKLQALCNNLMTNRQYLITKPLHDKMVEDSRLFGDEAVKAKDNLNHRWARCAGGSPKRDSTGK